MIAVQQPHLVEGTTALPSAAQLMIDAGARDGATVYRGLTGCHPWQALTEDDDDFDRHVLASILAVAATEPCGILAGSGLAAADLVELIARWFPAAFTSAAEWGRGAAATDDDEVLMVRDMLLMQRSTEGDLGRFLAAMVARRAIEPNHLWEDLGLRDRSELSRLLLRHFAPMAARNTANMRWKRFFYRMLCEQDGFVMCATPVCTNCNDFSVCFGDESGESRMADRRREASLEAASATLPSLTVGRE